MAVDKSLFVVAAFAVLTICLARPKSPAGDRFANQLKENLRQSHADGTWYTTLSIVVEDVPGAGPLSLHGMTSRADFGPVAENHGDSTITVTIDDLTFWGKYTANGHSGKFQASYNVVQKFDVELDDGKVASASVKSVQFTNTEFELGKNQQLSKAFQDYIENVLEIQYRGLVPLILEGTITEFNKA